MKNSLRSNFVKTSGLFSNCSKSKILAKINPPRRFNSLQELKRNFSKARTGDEFLNTFSNKRASDDQNHHHLCLNCSQKLESDSKILKDKKTPKNSPKRETIMMLQRPQRKSKPSPYDANRNFKVLKDIFSVQVVDNPTSVYAVTADGNFLYNQSL